MSASLRSVDGQDEATILREIQSALRDLRFGAVESPCTTHKWFRSNAKKNSGYRTRARKVIEPNALIGVRS